MYVLFISYCGIFSEGSVLVAEEIEFTKKSCKPKGFFSGLLAIFLWLEPWRFIYSNQPLCLKVALLFNGRIELDMMFPFAQQVTCSEVVVLYASIIYTVSPFNINSCLFFGSSVGLCWGTEWRTESWSGLQRAGLSGPDHLPGNVPSNIQKVKGLVSHIILSFFPPFLSFFSYSGSKLAGKEILRRLPGAWQTPALVYLWSPIFRAQWAAKIRDTKGHCRGTTELQLRYLTSGG